ncbi:MAG TPA: thioredoxin family protein [Gammaproteobacteria bacterium]|nr:thioredoxin family protein [Gammaproteobacteria bacterium]
MTLTPSKMTELGTPAPDFELPDTRGNRVCRSDFADARGLLVIFMCNHCPYVKHLREALAAFGEEYQPKGLAVVGINSNDASSHPEDSLENMILESERFGYTFPYLRDETQSVAKAYGATCTPDFFLYDSDGRLVYRGQFDDSRPGNKEPITGKDLRSAADALLEGRGAPEMQKPSVGCSIKWKPGNAPDSGGR